MKLHLSQSREYLGSWSMLTGQKLSYYLCRLIKFCEEHDFEMSEAHEMAAAEIMQDFGNKAMDTLVNYFYISKN